MTYVFLSAEEKACASPFSAYFCISLPPVVKPAVLKQKNKEQNLNQSGNLSITELLTQ